MPPPFRPRSIDDFATELDRFDFGATRLTGVHVHHTYRPDHATYESLGGARCVAGMHRYHTAALGWSDIAQHESTGPDGLIWSGRPWLRPPASSRGYNGTRAAHPFMVEMVGDFETVADQTHDTLADRQARATVGICALICQRFNLKPGDAVKFHRELAEKWKSCPGNLIDKDDWIAAVEGFSLGRRTAVHRPASGGQPYIVQPGDSLWQIAHEHGLSLQQLCEWNDVAVNHAIHPGDRIDMPLTAWTGVSGND